MYRIQNILLMALIFVTPALSAESNYQVGYQKLVITFKDTSEDFPVALVYPTKTPSENVSFGPFELKLAIGAPIATRAKGKFPLVIISHGSGGTNLGHRSIAFALVKKGFVVGMPLHPKNNYKDNSAEGTTNNWVNRPKHIKATIDAIVSKAIISESVDANKVAIIGHSAGGYTALALAGGVADTAHLFNLCKNHAKGNQEFCGLGTKLPTAFVSEEIKNDRDDRIKAIVLMAPVGVLFKSKKALENVDASILLLRAEKDSQLIEPHHSDVIAKNYNHKEKLSYRTIQNSGHYSFITPFPKSIRGSLGAVAEDPEGFDRGAFHETLSKEITEFLVKTLK